MKINEYMKERVDNQIEYFDEESIKNRKYYFSLSKAKIIVSALITFISLVFGEKTFVSIIIGLLSSLVTVTESIMNLKQYDEKWMIYRLTNEALKREKYLYEMSAGCYENLHNNLKNIKFTRNIESIIATSNDDWKKICEDRKN